MLLSDLYDFELEWDILRSIDEHGFIKSTKWGDLDLLSGELVFADRRKGNPVVKKLPRVRKQKVQVQESFEGMVWLDECWQEARYASV